MNRITVNDLKPGELEIVDRSVEMRKYECGHEDSASFALLLGGLNFKSPIIQQNSLCPTCARVYTCSNLTRCPICHEVYESIRNPQGNVPLTSLIHFKQCLPNCVKIKVVPA